MNPDTPNHRPPLTVEQLQTEIDSGVIDTVIVAFTDMQGRLQGKRIHGPFFRDHVLGHGTEGCNYLLAVDVDMKTIEGYAISSWDRGYGDMMFAIDLDTLRRTPGQHYSATVQADLHWLDGSGAVRPSPRSVLSAQVEAAAELGYQAFAGTELEFIVFDDTYEQAWDRRYQGLTGANRYNVDYSILGGSKVEPLLREIRNEMYAAGMTVESAKGECNLGQHEIAFLYDEVVRTCDNHVIYKTAAKEIAAAHGKSITFMAKYDQREGNSCHIHLSLSGTDGSIVFADDDREGGQSEVFDSFVAGVQATMHELTLLYAPNINFYKRFAAGSFAPTTIAWAVTTAPARCGWSVTAPACGSRTAFPEATSTPTWRWPPCWPAACTGCASSCRWSHRCRATPTPPDANRCQAPWPRRPTPSKRPRWPGPRSATTWSSTMFMPPGSNRPPSTRPSPIGNGSEVSSDCEDRPP